MFLVKKKKKKKSRNLVEVTVPPELCSVVPMGRLLASMHSQSLEGSTKTLHRGPCSFLK